MAKCNYCNSLILFGAIEDEQHKFCSEVCYDRGFLLRISHQVPDYLVAQHISSVHKGPCPRCEGEGPVDVHTSHRVWSALITTSWHSIPTICCRTCGIRSQLGHTLFSLLLGWWGIPWGMLMTPIQVVRNLKSMLNGPNPSQPSDRLEHMLRLNLADELMTPTS